MKKILAIAMTVIMVVSLAVSVSAFYQENTNVNPTYTINKGYKAQVLDGVISEGEYSKVEIADGDLSYALANESDLEKVKNYPISLYMSYDADYVYFAATTTAEGFYTTATKGGDFSGTIWAEYAIQVQAATTAATSGDERLELGFGITNEGDSVTCTWNGSYTAEDGSFIVVKTDDTITYEGKIPVTAFGNEQLAEGSQFRFLMLWATGTAAGYEHTQLANGCSGDPGKNVTGMATFTCGAALEEPVVEPDPAPVTADALLAVAALAVVAAGAVVIAKKH